MKATGIVLFLIGVSLVILTSYVVAGAGICFAGILLALLTEK